MSPLINASTSLPDRLRTFQGKPPFDATKDCMLTFTFAGYWDDNEATARQLAALGHVYDGFAALEEGSYCVSCNAFVKREVSIAALEGPISRISSTFNKRSDSFTAAVHHPNCVRWQTRIPLDTRNTHDFTHSNSQIDDMKQVFEPKSTPSRPHTQNSSLFVLPTELRLEIYSMIMPAMDCVTAIVPLNRESSQVITHTGFTKTSRRNTTKCNILRTNRAIYNDAHDMLFTGTTFKFDSTRVLYLFLRNIGTHGRQLLKSIDVSCCHREDAVAFSLLAACPELRSITLRIAKTKLLNPNVGKPIWIVDGLACLLELSGLQSVTFAECKDRVFLEDDMHDAHIVRRELTRPKGTESGVRWIDGMPDL